MRIEWPTIAIMVACYGAWALALWLPVGLSIVVLTAAIALQSSLQHEVLHGHPFPDRRIGEALVFASLNLVIPYIRFRDTHLDHHRDASLTDPYDDPETNYLDSVVWAQMSAPMRGILRMNNTLLGRMALGPALAQFSFMGGDARRIVGGDRRVAWVWAAHMLACVPIVWLVSVSPLPVWAYLVACYAALSILKIRTFLEHQAHASCPERSVIIEDRGPLSILFLNNNFHAVHHLHPQVPWYDLPALYASQRDRYLQRNGGYRYAGYGAIFRCHLLRAKDPVAHPLYRTRP